MTLTDVRAQPTAVETLRRALASDRVASAYLFEGPSGVGKTRAAIGLAQALLCTAAPNHGCGTCATCTRIETGGHPDVRLFAPREEGAGNIQVEYLRETILPFTRYAPFEAARAVTIFPDADISFPAAHPEGANALLKT
ncbi:MAG: DNA polymerase III subunit gamma/tau, partial [Myxococcales bacterium]|nr:DNA polymerase III subunit gamma/tau [Myxococcales bacterium]